MRTLTLTILILALLSALALRAQEGPFDPQASQVNNKLASLSIGMSKQELRLQMGTETAYIYMQAPPSALVAGTPGVGDMASQMLEPLTPGNMAGYTQVFVTDGGNTEIELTPSAGAAGDMSGMPAMPPPGEAAGDEGQSSSRLPIWAYVVYAGVLQPNQQQWFYRINDTYSIGVVLEGEFKDMKVTDIIVCSLDPLRVRFDPNTGKSVNIFQGTGSVNYKSRTQPKVFPARSASGLMIGSLFDEVLLKEGWPAALLPFAAKPVTKLTLMRGSQAVPVGNASAPIIGGTPNTGATTTYPLPLGSGPAVGTAPASFSDGASLNISAGFTKNALMVYPKHNISYLLMNYRIVRMHVGKGVALPPDPNAIPPTTDMPNPLDPPKTAPVDPLPGELPAPTTNPLPVPGPTLPPPGGPLLPPVW